ncbi:hypothetical protein AB0J63_39480 [Streptosporangium canum]
MAELQVKIFDIEGEDLGGPGGGLIGPVLGSASQDAKTSQVLRVSSGE